MAVHGDGSKVHRRGSLDLLPNLPSAAGGFVVHGTFAIVPPPPEQHAARHFRMALRCRETEEHGSDVRGEVI